MADRHFDELASRFAEKIYGGAKGAIRLAVLQRDLSQHLPKRPLRVLDIGAGLGHMSYWLAEQGHHVTVSEPAAPMLQAAQQRFAEACLEAEFIQAAFQQLPELGLQPFDLVICHAVLEWLENPLSILPILRQLCADDGWLSLAFYNKDALVYRNLLKGHFRKLRKQSFAGEGQSLTPQEPLDPRELEQAMSAHWRIMDRSGVRVFHDYMPTQFQQQAQLEELVEMELSYSKHPSFIGLGRYIHWLCQPTQG